MSNEKLIEIIVYQARKIYELERTLEYEREHIQLLLRKGNTYEQRRKKVTQ